MNRGSTEMLPWPCRLACRRLYSVSQVATETPGSLVGVFSHTTTFRRLACAWHQTAPGLADEVLKARLLFTNRSSPAPFSIEEEILLRVATEEVPARIERISERIDSSSLEVIEEDAAGLNDTEAGEVVIAASRPVVVESFYKTPELGRFVLVRGNDVVAGGIIAHSLH